MHRLQCLFATSANSLFLSPGVTGYIASHTADQFLEAGYKVRGTARDLGKAQWLFEVFDKKYGKGQFDVVVVKDMMAEGAFDEAVKRVDGVVHMVGLSSFTHGLVDNFAGCLLIVGTGRRPHFQR